MGSVDKSSGSVDVADGNASPAFDITRIAVIGAGPSGLAAAKHLLAEGFSSSQIDMYEQQAEAGGVWNYSAATYPQPPRVPQTDAHAAPDPPLYPAEEGDDEGEEDEYADYEFDSDEEACTAPGSGACSLPSLARGEKEKKEKRLPIFPGPMYDDLHTNIPHTLMRYSDLGFATGGRGGEGTHEGCEIFPPRQIVHEYLLRYARDVRHLIRFSTQVTDVSLAPPQSGLPGAGPGEPRARIRDMWTVRSTDLLTDASRAEGYDAVVVASGHYSAPHIPAVARDMAAFAAAHPGVISHAKSYRAAAAFAGKRVVVVGSGPSGVDIAAQIGAVCAPPLLLSARSPVPEDTAAHLGVGGRVRVVGPITRFLVNERGVEVENRGGEETKEERIRDVDAVVFCTGYLYTFPFFSSVAASSSALSLAPLVTDGRRVHGLARHFLHTDHPTFVFPGLPIKIIPFPLAEAQAAVFARLWANRLPLPPREELRRWEREDEEGRGPEGARVPGKPFHTFPKGGDARYINALHDWAAEAVGRQRGEAAGGRRRDPPFWGEEELWQRSIYAQAKMRFESTGRKATSLAELGFRHQGGEKAS
ncbi:hypothetical protein F4802DRAFT_598858 [Xylaria palmicola]|nr:hypothetical protein F4802DRAFT_598858 [Xylaria palmicola]